MNIELWFMEKIFLWNRWIPIFPPIVFHERMYVIEKIFIRYDHCFNGGKFLGFIARYQRVN